MNIYLENTHYAVNLQTFFKKIKILPTDEKHYYRLKLDNIQYYVKVLSYKKTDKQNSIFNYWIKCFGFDWVCTTFINIKKVASTKRTSFYRKHFFLWTSMIYFFLWWSSKYNSLIEILLMEKKNPIFSFIMHIVTNSLQGKPTIILSFSKFM